MEITTVRIVTKLLIQCFNFEYKLPLRYSSADCTLHSPGLAHYFHLPETICVILLLDEKLCMLNRKLRGLVSLRSFGTEVCTVRWGKESLYWFSVSSVTKYHNLCGLKMRNQSFYSVRGQIQYTTHLARIKLLESCIWRL
jgi:hypothetical protein